MNPLWLLLTLLSGLGTGVFWYHHTKEPEAPPRYGEMFRPAYHFSPPENWMNDPNGLTFINGRYHMYYQYNPYGIVWGNMSWGHASSADLVYWDNHPVAISEYNIPYYGLVDIWSGCNIIDVNNTSGFCEQNGCLLAYYTMFTTHGQAQAFAYSNDGGMTYTQFYGNPIIELGEDAFRDPKVIWYEPDQKWVMVNALSNDFKLLLWYSTDLINWLQMSVFGPEGSTTGVWEDPDLFQLTVEGENTTMWILSHSTDVNSVEYYVGNFDGQKFKTTDSKGTDLFIDYGFDFDEAASWNNEPQGRRLMIAWLDEGAYGGQLPERVWRGSQTLIRELKLRRYPEGLRIVQQPLDALQVLRANNTHYDNLLLNDSTGNVTLSFSGPQLEIMANFTISNETGNAVTRFGIKVFTGSNQTTVIGYDVPSGLLFVDRSDSGLVDFSPVFFSICNTSLEPESGAISLRIFVDHSSVEVFANDGKIAMTNLIFPDPTQDEVQVFAVGGDVNLSLDAWNLNSIWPGRENSKLPKKGNVQSVVDQLKQYLSL